VLGGAIGYWYSYIDLALTDVRRALPVLKRVLRRHRLGPRAWLQFFDRDLQREWVGLAADSPPPPMPPEE
jgi:hypothetical protein